MVACTIFMSKRQNPWVPLLSATAACTMILLKGLRLCLFLNSEREGGARAHDQACRCVVGQGRSKVQGTKNLEGKLVLDVKGRGRSEMRGARALRACWRLSSKCEGALRHKGPAALKAGAHL